MPNEKANQADRTPSPPESGVVDCRYGLVRQLKSSAGISTYLATDTFRAGAPVIIKLTESESLSAPTVMRLEHEAGILASLSGEKQHPQDVHRLARDHNLIYLVMPFVSGVTLAERLLVGPISVIETLSVGIQIALSLAKVHDHGVLHRDIKPSNIVIDPAGTIAHATLIDFGLARSAIWASEINEALAFTARYTAPEQAGLIDYGVDERSDLYSLGVVLYECLAGHPPFMGTTLNDVLMQHLSAQPLGIDINKAMPRVLEDLIFKLLEKDPRDRYQSAEGLKQDLANIKSAIDIGKDDTSFILGKKDRREDLTEPTFVPRQRELQSFESILTETKLGRASLALLEAPSGSGKSRLLNEVARGAQRSDFLVLRGQGVDQTASRPYQALSGVIRGALEMTRRDDMLRQRLMASLKPYAASLAAINTDFAEFLGTPVINRAAPEQFGEARSMLALSTFLGALGIAKRPVLLLFDDCQWADAMTLKLLKQFYASSPLFGGAEPNKNRFITALLAFRTEDADAAHPVRDLKPLVHHVLPPMTTDQIAVLVESMAGSLPKNVLTNITELAGGSPFMAAAVLRGMVETGALKAKDDGWIVASAALDHLQSSRKAAAVLRRRMDRLPAATLDLLSVGAILGKSFDASMATSLLDFNHSETLAALVLSRKRQITWENARTGQICFSHDKLREALIERLPSDERKKLHLRIADLMEEQDSTKIFDLAYHFDAASEPMRAYPYALQAAAKARSQSALEIAEQQYRIAARCLEHAPDPAAQSEVERGLGEVLMLRGRYDEAQKHMNHAKKFAGDPFQSASIEASLGELAFKRGDMPAATLALSKALNLLGRFVPKKLLTFLPLLVWEFLIQTIHTLFPKFIRNSGSMDPATALALKVYSRLAYVFWFEKGKYECGWAHLTNMNLAERYPESSQLAQAYSEHAPVATTIPLFARGITYVERSLAIRRNLQDEWGQGQSLSFFGVILYSSSRYEEAIVKCNEAVELLERTGDKWEVNTANWHIALSHYRLGQMADAIRMAKKVYREAQEIGDQSSTGIALGIWSKASQGDLPGDLIEAELARNMGDLHTKAELLQGEAIRLLHAKDPASAVAALSTAHRMVQQAGLHQEYVAPIVPWLLTALRQDYEAQDAFSSKRDDLMRKAQRLLGFGLRLSNQYKNNRPHMLREAAYVEAWRGNPQKAKAHLLASMKMAQDQGAKNELKLTLDAMARLGFSSEARKESFAGTDDVARPKNLAPAKSLKSPVDNRSVLSIFARFETMMATGRTIIAAMSRDEVYAALHDSAQKLFRAEGCLVIAARPHATDVKILVGDPTANFSHTFVQRAVTEMRPMVMNDFDEASPNDSLLLSDAKSALCIPIKFRGDAVACLYVAHGRLGRLFNDVEIEMGKFLAVLTETALENADSFAQMKALNHALTIESAERKEAVEQARIAKELAEDASRIKSEFLANMSHEIRTPLGVILGFSQLMASPVSDEERLDYSQRVRRNGEQLLSLIDDILDLSKVEAGHLKTEFLPCAIKDEIIDCLQPFYIKAESKGLPLSLTFASDLPNIIAVDALRLRQVIANLLSNALKFTESGAIAVKVQWTSLQSGYATGQLKIAVQDTGVGMSPSTAAGLFRPFFQGDGSTTRQFGGTGLGLALSRRLAQLMQGDLVLTSTSPGQGTEFTLLLDVKVLTDEILRSPHSQEPCPGDLQKMPRNRGAAATISDRKGVLAGLRILVVEDAVDNQLLIQSLLHREGATVALASDGEAGIRAAMAEDFDVVLMDIQMPNIDGYEATTALRARGYRRPIIALTAHALKDELDHCTQVGCDGFLTKPINQELLKKTVLESIAKKG